jgi:Zn-dependent protease with chaperone function
VSRRPGRATLALVVAMLAFALFGMARVVAPVSALGLLFDEPVGFAVVAAVTSVAGAVLLFYRPVELAMARLVAGEPRAPTAEESERLMRLLTRAGERGGLDPERLIVHVQDDPGVNASAGAGHLLFVTSGALGLPDDQLEAVLAHELGHHRGLHPVLTAVLLWLRIPGTLLNMIYRWLRRAVALVGASLGVLGRLLAVPLVLLLVIWQIAVMWLFYVGELLASRAARVTEYDADATAASWGYAEPLAHALEGLGAKETAPTGRLARLTADHPPLPLRIDRLRSQE